MPDETPLTAKILVVDDEETNVRLLGACSRRPGTPTCRARWTRVVWSHSTRSSNPT